MRDFPAHEFYRRLNWLRTFDATAFSQAQVDERLKQAMHGFATKLLTIGTNGVFRARASETSTPFASVNELWSPPADKVVRRGRFNDVGDPRFYCSNRVTAASYEVRPKIGQTVTILIAPSRTVAPGSNVHTWYPAHP